MQATNQGDVEDALMLIDQSHARLLADRQTLSAVERALRKLGRSGLPEPDRPRPAPTLVGPLARQLG
jgi:hypothetical protein